MRGVGGGGGAGGEECQGGGDVPGVAQAPCLGFTQLQQIVVTVSVARPLVRASPGDEKSGQ